MTSECCEPTPTSKKIVLHVARMGGDNYAVQIAEQTGITRDSSELWTAPNGITFRSAYRPEWTGKRNTLFLRGHNHGLDNSVLVVPTSDFVRLVDAVRAFNKAHAVVAPVSAAPTITLPAEVVQ